MSAFKKGDAVRYVSDSGDLWDAVVTAVRSDGLPIYEIAVTIPGCRAPYDLHHVRSKRLMATFAYGPPFTTDVP